MHTVNGICTVRDILRRPIHIRSMEGIVVVTRKNDAEDYILATGEGITIRPKGLLAIQGLTDGAEATVTRGQEGNTGTPIRLKKA